jgi:hypothetical protein
MISREERLMLVPLLSGCMEYRRAYSLTGSMCTALTTIAYLFIPTYLLAL